jgi:L-ribulokinase
MTQKKRYALGLDYGTESVRAIVVDCETGDEAAQATHRYAHGVMTEHLPVEVANEVAGSSKKLPGDFALQHPQDYLDSAFEVLGAVLKRVPASEIIGIGVDFTACTILPVKRDGTPLAGLPEFAAEPHAWVKLWKHHAAQPEADRINALAQARGEKFLEYYGGLISSEWMLPKCWEVATHAPQVYEAADLFIDAGDWIVQQMTGRLTRNSCAAGYKGLWNAELGFPSPAFLRELDPKIENLAGKWLQNIVAPGVEAGRVSRTFAEKSGLVEGTPVSAATIDAHSGVAGMGVYQEGPLCVIMGTSSCHMALSRELKLFEGYAGVVKDGILPGFYGYESGQSAVGDIFGWFAKGIASGAATGASGGRDPFAALSSQAAALRPGESGLVALDWLSGNRSVLMNADLSGMILGLTLATKPAEIYRALIEGTAFGTRKIVESYREGGVPVRELVVCGGLTQDALIMQIYSDVTGLRVRVAESSQAVALGAAIFGALAAGSSHGGFDTAEGAIVRMVRPAVRVFEPRPEAVAIYDQLYAVYLHAHDHFGREQTGWMKTLKALKN